MKMILPSFFLCLIITLALIFPIGIIVSSFPEIGIILALSAFGGDAMTTIHSTKRGYSDMNSVFVLARTRFSRPVSILVLFCIYILAIFVFSLIGLQKDLLIAVCAIHACGAITNLAKIANCRYLKKICN